MSSIPRATVQAISVDSGECVRCGEPATRLIVVNGRTDGTRVCRYPSQCSGHALAGFNLRDAEPYGAS